MARKTRLVTRTITTSLAKVVTHDVETETTETKMLKIARAFKNTNELLDALREKYETPTFKVAAVIEYWTETDKYALTEDAFISNGYIITKKDEDEETDEDELEEEE